MKKPTTISLLTEIRDLLKKSMEPEITGVDKSMYRGVRMRDIICLDPYRNNPTVTLEDSQFLIYIPEITMKEIVEKCDNKTSKGTPLLYSIDWHKDEKFYTEEKSREGWYIVSKELLTESLNKNWNEQEEILKGKGGIRLNAPEVLYILYAYEKVKGVHLFPATYYRTHSRSSFGDIVVLGFGASGGVCVDFYGPGPSHSFRLGVCFSRRVS